MSGDPHSDIGKWLDGHHHVAEGAKGEQIHVFATKHGNVYGKGDAGDTYEISFKLGPVTISIIVTIGPGNTITICVYASIPLLPPIKIGCVSGTLDDKGLTITFETGTISGSFTFYVKDQWLWVHYDVTALGEHLVGDIKLIPVHQG